MTRFFLLKYFYNLYILHSAIQMQVDSRNIRHILMRHVDQDSELSKVIQSHHRGANGSAHQLPISRQK